MRSTCPTKRKDGWKDEIIKERRNEGYNEEQRKKDGVKSEKEKGKEIEEKGK
jgi:hypothetical protein